MRQRFVLQKDTQKHKSNEVKMFIVVVKMAIQFLGWKLLYNSIFNPIPEAKIFDYFLKGGGAQRPPL